MPAEMIPDVVLTDNTSQRLPCVLVLDGSTSMSKRFDGTSAIEELNKGLKVLEQELKKDDTACQRVQLLVLRLGDDDQVQTIQDWTDAIDFSAPIIKAKGRTPLGIASRIALEKIEQQKENYRAHDIPYNRPWLFLITDGGPSDARWKGAALDCCFAEAEGKVIVFPIGTKNANFDKLSRFSARPPIKLAGLNFEDLFVWLSRSAASGSQASPTAELQLPDAEWTDNA